LLQDYRPNRESSDFVSEEPEETVVKPLSSVPNQSVTCVHFLFTRWENNKSFLSLKSLFVRFRKIRAKISGRFCMVPENFLQDFLTVIFLENFQPNAGFAIRTNDLRKSDQIGQIRFCFLIK